MKLVITQEFNGYSPDQVVPDLPDDIAQSLIDLGYAVEVPDGEAAPDEAAPADESAKSFTTPNVDVDAIVNRITKELDAKIAKSVAEAHKAVKPREFRNFAEPLDKTGGLKNFGEMARCIYKAYRGDNGARNTLRRYKAAVGQTESNTEGGYLVPEEWSSTIFEKARSQVMLADMCTQYTASGDTINIPIVNDNSRVDGSRPLRAYKVAEGIAMTASKVVYGNVQLIPTKFAILAGATEELLADNAYNIEAHLTKEFGDEIRHTLNYYILQGSGSSEPTGVLNSACLVYVAKESAQASSTLLFQNMVKMWSRLYYSSRPNAVWLVSQSVMASIISMAFPNASGTVPIGGLSWNAQDEYQFRFLGRPIIECEECQMLGGSVTGGAAAGDIILVDLSQMAMFQKPISIKVSDQFHFDTDDIAYKATIRFDTKPLWQAALVPFKGDKTLSPFVTREAVYST